MKISLKIKLDEKKLRKLSPNPICEYAELIEVLREHGFVHQSPLDIGFINNDATKELALQAVSDALERLSWLSLDIITECRAIELGDSVDIELNKMTDVERGISDAIDILFKSKENKD